jgi:exosortase A-associated hydrolase 1
MNRRHLTFECQGDLLVGTLDQAPGKVGLLIVSGGNELRCGPFGSHAALADAIAAAGFPVFRYDRRGVGDSSGTNATFAASADDIQSALLAFRAQVPGLRQIVAFGNCDAASTLMLSKGQGCESLVLANPWTFEPAPETLSAEAPQPQMPPITIRRHYLRRLTDPRALLRLLTGKVKVGQLAESLAEAIKLPPAPSSLAQGMAEGLKAFTGPATLLIAENDRTGQAFLDSWDKADPRLRRCPGAGHSFAEPQARIWLLDQILGALRGLG